MIDLTSLAEGQMWLLGLKVIGLVLLGRLGWLMIDLGVQAMRRHNESAVQYAGFDYEPDPIEDLADSLKEAHTEPVWRGKTTFVDPADDEHGFPAPAEPAGYPDLDEDQVLDDPTGKPATGDGRVSVDEVTGYVRLRSVVPTEAEKTVAMDRADLVAVSDGDGAP